MDLTYLQKYYAVKFTCDEDILTGYEATKIQLSEANIELKSLKNLERNGKIYQHRNNLNNKHYRSQGKSLYQIFLKTEAFKSFPKGKKVMEDKASTMDGFSVLQQLLRMVHPVYTQKSPPKIAPVYDDDIYKYQQQTRHYFHLWKLANHSDTDYHKAIYFLGGLAGTEWEDTARTIYNRISLDNPDITKGKVNEDYCLSSIATTVVNETKDSPFQAEARINMAYDDNMPLHDDLESEHICVNVVQNPYWRQQTSFQNKQQYRQQPPRPDNPHAKPYDKIRNTRQNQSFQNRKTPNSRGKPFAKHKLVVCDACGMFGHDNMNCYVTPKVLHILE